MRAETRMLVTVGGLGLGAVLVLGMMAQRYTHVVSERVDAEQQRQARIDSRRAAREEARSRTVRAGSASAPATASAEEVTESADVRAQRYVNGFLEIRKAMHEAIQADPSATAARRTDIARRARDAELSRSWLAEHEYRQMLLIYRAWRSGRSAPTPEFERALTSRRGDVARFDLGPIEEVEI